MKVTKKINGDLFQFEFEGELKESLVEALSFLKKDICPCGSDEIEWTGYKTKEGYLYVKRVCKKCGKMSQLSQNQTTKEYFWKEWEVDQYQQEQDVNNI